MAHGGGMAEAGDVVMDRSWGVVAAATVGLAFSVGTLLLYTFGVFVQPLSAEFGWSRTQLSGALGVSQYVFALSAPFWGILIDRFGPRRVMLPSVVLISALVASLALLTPNLWHYYLVFGLVPLLAGGASPLGYSAVLVRRFDRHVGLALGLALMGVGLGAAILPPLAHALATSFGWRAAYAALGGMTLLFTFPAALVATRGSQILGRQRPGAAKVPLGSYVKTRAFVLMCVVFLLLGTVCGGTLVNLVPILTSRGFAPAAAAQLAGVTGLALIAGRGGIGWLLDRLHPPHVVCAIALLAMAAFLLIAYGEGTVSAFAIAALLGATVGAEVDFTAFFVRRYFGNAAFGRLYGLVFGIFIIGSGTGPVLVSAVFDHFGSYAPGALASAAAVAAAAVLTFAMPRLAVSASAVPAYTHDALCGDLE